MTNPTSAEACTRRDLAACYRLVAHFGWDDLIFTHISARVGDTDEFLLNPFGMTFDEITASSLVKVDAEGTPVGATGQSVNGAGFVIHSAVHHARPDVRCVIHLHTFDGIAVSALEEGLLPLNQKVMGVFDDVAYHDYEGVSVDVEERERLAADLGEKHLMILRNHGTLAVGRSVGEAFLRAHWLETSCSVQVKALGMGRPVRPMSAEAMAQAAGEVSAERMGLLSERLVWPALLRKLDREHPGYDA